MTHGFWSLLTFNFYLGVISMETKLILVVLTALFTVTSLLFGTRNGFYDTDDYHGNGSAH